MKYDWRNLYDDDLVATNEFTGFDGTNQFGRVTSLWLYVDKEGRSFCCNDEPEFNPYTGKPVGRIFRIEDMNGES
jgi:hypothetical protein